MDEIFHYLTSTWLEQQDLSGKSPADILDMYFKAAQEIQQAYNKNYAPEIPTQSGRRIRSPGLKMDD